MADFQEIADRVEIEALRGEFTDAGTMRDSDRFAALFTEDGVWRIPAVNVAFGSRAEIRDGGSHRNYAVYHDRYRRTPDGWKFAERVYEVKYVDSTPLTGTAPDEAAPLPDLSTG